MSYSLSAIYIYPVKSLGGMSVASSKLTARGLAHDRRWMLVDETGRFISQRTHPHMSRLHLSALEGGFRVTYKDNPHWYQDLPFALTEGTAIQVQVWNDEMTALLAPESVSEWFTDMLSVKCRLVYMPDTTHRKVDEKYAQPADVVSFADGFPILLAGEAALADLNGRLETPVGMDRFRPNLVFAGGTPFEEDEMRSIQIGSVSLDVVKACSRCVLINVDPATAKKSKEPLKTLATYRSIDKKVKFGQNVLGKEGGELRVGDELTVKTRKPV